MKIYLFRNGQNYGPYSDKTLSDYLESGLVTKADLVCKIGSEEWVKLGDLLEEDDGTSNDKIPDALSDQEALEYAEKIKTIVQGGDDEMAIDLVRSLNDPKLYSELLKDCSIEQGEEDEEDSGKPLLPDWLWNKEKGNDHRPFFLLLLHHCPENAEVDTTLKRENLTHLDLRNCSSLTNVDVLNGLTSLTSLNLSGCTNLNNVDALSGLTSLTELDLDCSNLTNVEALSGLTSLNSLSLYHFQSLTNVDVLSGLTSLTRLILDNCSSLTNVDALSGLTNLRGLILDNCSSLTNVDALSGLTNLTHLGLYRCESLTNVEALSGLTSLTELKLSGCESLTNVDVLRNALPDCEICF